jgi:hypothetical protein
MRGKFLCRRFAVQSNAPPTRQFKVKYQKQYDNRKLEESAETNAPGGGSEILLRSEVAFWRDLIEACGAEHSAASVERMQQALALAEYRLMQFYRAAGGAAQTRGDLDGTSEGDWKSIN